MRIRKPNSWNFQIEMFCGLLVVERKQKNCRRLARFSDARKLLRDSDVLFAFLALTRSEVRPLVPLLRPAVRADIRREA